MSSSEVKKIAIIGSGAMGHGIAQVCAMAGFQVSIKDIKQDFLDNAINKIEESLKFLVGKEKITQENKENILTNLLKTTLDTKEAVSGAQVVIEAVPEIMDLKKNVFKELSSIVDKKVILATNTSTMSISEIGSVVDNPERFVGMHFFNPVTRMKLVEIIYGDKTSDQTANELFEIVKQFNKIPIKVLKDRPGFIVNRISAPNQALLSAILDEGKIQPAEIDCKMKKMGVKMAPFEVADFVGLDVFSHTLNYYSKTLSEEYKPGKYLTEKINNKELGMKTGKGIYQWHNGKAIIDDSKETEEITPIHFLAVQINEAVKVYKEKIAESVQDIDDGVKYGMGAFAGPFTLAAGMPPEQLTETLNYLVDRYKLDILKPEPEIVDGSFKTMGK